MISTRAVSKTYRSAALAFTALADVDLQIEAGEYVALVGKSGSGKSTLINLLAGIDAPSSGRITVAGTEIHGLSEDTKAAWRGRTVGLVFQFFQLLPALTVLENVVLPMEFCGTFRGARTERARMLLAQMDIAEQADKFPAFLSGGQQQRAAIARALANDPPVLLADEPTGNLDSRTSESMLALFRTLADGGKTILVATHEPAAERFVDRQIALVDGRVDAPGRTLDRAG